MSAPRSRRVLLKSLALLAAVLLMARPTQAEDEFPYTLSGDGMTVVIQGESENGLSIRGTMQVTTSQAWPFDARLQQGPDGSMSGRGEVRAGQRRVPFVVSVDATGSVAVTLAGKVYRLKPAAQGGEDEDTPPVVNPQPQPAPGPHVPGGNHGATPKHGKTLRLRQKTLFDQHMTQQGMNSHVVHVPEGWQVTGGAFYMNPQLFFNLLPSQHIRVASTDGRETIVGPQLVLGEQVTNGRRLQPGQALHGYPVSPMPKTHQEVASQIAKEFIPTTWPGATQIQVGNVARIHELRHLLEQGFAQMKQFYLANSGGMRSWADCDVLGIEAEFTVGGVRYEMLRVVSIAWFGFQSQLAWNQMWEVTGDVTYKAPKGQLKKQMPLLRTISQSVRETPAWAQRRWQLKMQLAKIREEGRREAMRQWQKRSQIIATTGAEINRIITSGWNNRQAIRDATHAKVIRAIRDVNLVQVPGTNTAYEIPNHYDRVYYNGTDMILTNDHAFDPGPGWNALQPR